MLSTLTRLLDERGTIYNAAKETMDLATGDRSLTSEEEAKVDKAFADLDKLDVRIDQIRKAVDADKTAEEARASLPADPAKTDPTAHPLEQEGEQLRKFMNGEIRSLTFKRENRDLTVGTDSAGGNLVPTSFVNRLHEHMIDVSAVRRAGPTVFSTTSGEDLQVPKTTAFSTASLIAEGAAITESDPAFGQVTFGAFKYAILMQASRELGEDNAVTLAEFLARQAGRAIGNKSGEHFITGTGSSQPNGLATASTLGHTGAAGQTTSVTADDLIDLFYSVIEAYRRNGTWLMRDASVAKVRKLKDSDNQYLWSPGLVAGQPDTILGRPLLTDPNVAAMAASAKSIVFGDVTAYGIRDVNAVRFERSDEYAFNADLVTYRAIFRTDGDLIDTTGAVKHYANAAS